VSHIKNSPLASKRAVLDKVKNIPAPPIVLDLAEPNEISRFSPWDLDFRQIEPGPINARTTIRPGESVTILELCLDRVVHQKGCSPDGSFTFGLPNFHSMNNWCGRQIDGSSVLNFGSNEEYESVTGADFTGLTISISEQFMTELADQIGLPLSDVFSRREVPSVRQNAADYDALREFGRTLLHQSTRRFGGSDQEELVCGLISAFVEPDRLEDQSTLSTRTISVRRALDYIAANAGEGILISDLCVAAKVSWRTLDRGFKEYFGIGPKAYLNRYRLNQTRFGLLARQTGSSIVETANEWGFWHMGQFAHDYRQMFGELPSETLSNTSTNGRTIPTVKYPSV
jgi:AraC family ethanolamine operon transcriptional activator